MREWASSNDAAFQQRSGRQRTTMTRSGILMRNQSVMQTKNKVTNINVTAKFYSMKVTKLMSRTRKVITRNR